MSQKRESSQQRKKEEVPPPKQEKEEESGSSSDEEEEEAPFKQFADDAAAEAGRKEGLALFNADKYQEALDFQGGVCAYWCKKHGDFHPKAALAYLDYGLTLLAIIESRDAEKAALEGLVEGGNREEQEDDFTSCFQNLECARIGFEKAEKANPKDQDIQKRLIEVHDAIAAFKQEAGDDEGAITHYETVKTMNSVLEEPSKRRAYVADYCIAKCYCQAENWDAAEKPINSALALVNEDPDATADMKEYYKDLADEVKEMKERGGMDDLKEEIRAQFPDENSQIVDPEETLNEATNTNAFVTPLPSDLANHNKAVSSSVPLALMAPIAPKEGSNSVSFIQPPPGTTLATMGAPGQARPVNVVAVKKKPKSASAPAAQNGTSSPAAAKRDANEASDDAPANKKQRTE